jgi:hypothetical protein
MTNTPSTYLVINDNGDAFEVEATDDTYNDLSTLVDGYIECVALPGDVTAWVNEEGIFRPNNDFVLNLAATLMVQEWLGHGHHHLVGPTVFAGHNPATGDTLPCPVGFIANERQQGLMFLDGPWTVEECANRMAESRAIYSEVSP